MRTFLALLFACWTITAFGQATGAVRMSVWDGTAPWNSGTWTGTNVVPFLDGTATPSVRGVSGTGDIVASSGGVWTSGTLTSVSISGSAANQISTAIAPSVESFRRALIWQNDGTFFYRIPNADYTSAGTVIAACEARESTSDDGVIQIAMRRSTDGGRTWGTQYIPFPFSTPWSYGNPTFFKIPSSSRIGIVFHRHDYQDTRAELRAGTGIDVMRLFRSFSDDDGLTWTAMEELSAQTEVGYSMQNIGTGAGIIETSSNRIIIGRWRCPTGGAATDYECGVIYSTNSGTSFTYTNAGTGFECQAAQTNSGHITLNARPALSSIKSRMVYSSTDSGTTIEAGGTNSLLLPDPSNSGSIIALSTGGRWIFANTPNTDSRSNLAWRSSQDRCLTWSDPNVINVGQMSGGYSNLFEIAPTEVGLICEGGGGLNSPITLYVFNPLTQAAQEPIGVPSLVSDAVSRIVSDEGNISGDAVEVLRSGTFAIQRTASGSNYIIDLPGGGNYMLRIGGTTVWSQSGTIHAPLAIGTGTENIANIGTLNSLFVASVSPTITGTAVFSVIDATDPATGFAGRFTGTNVPLQARRTGVGNTGGSTVLQLQTSSTASPGTYNTFMEIKPNRGASGVDYVIQQMASVCTSYYIGLNGVNNTWEFSTSAGIGPAFTATTGDVNVQAIGKTILIQDGANSLAGTITLISGTGAIVSTALTTNCVIIPTLVTPSGVSTPPLIQVFSGSATWVGAATDGGTWNWVALKKQ